MVSSMISIKAVLISTGIAAMSLFLKSSVPMALDFSISRFPILWSSFLSWLEPPYLFVVTNVIITIIIASSKYYQSIDGTEDDEILHRGGYYKSDQIEPIVNQAPPRQLEVKDVYQDVDFEFMGTISPPILVVEVERSEVVYGEKEEEISALINGGDEFAVLRSESYKVPSLVKSENLLPAVKPLVSARSGHRKPVKASTKGGNKKKALKVVKVKPRQHETTENTWKMITEEAKSTPLTRHSRSSDTFRLDAGGDVKPVLRKADTFRDVTNYRQSSITVTPPPVKKKKEITPSREELNRRVEAFIRKCKEERLKSLKLEKEVV